MNENAIFVSFEILTTKGASEIQIHRVFSLQIRTGACVFVQTVRTQIAQHEFVYKGEKKFCN